MLCFQVICRVSDQLRNLGELPLMELMCFGIGYVDEANPRAEACIYIFVGSI